MLQLGGEPDGLTESLRQALPAYRDRLQPGDVLRMLKLLADSEGAIRRGSNPRLIVETLLLRWTMLDRLVDLEEVLAGVRGGEPAPGAPPPASAPTGGPAPSPSRRPPLAQDSGRHPVTEPASLPAGVRLAVEDLRHAWPDIVAELRSGSRFLGEALAAAVPVTVEASWLTVELSEPNPLFAERLKAQAPAVEAVLTRMTGEPVRLRVAQGASASGPVNPRRLSEEGIKADRLRSFRARDPSLDTAADALDLEIVD